MLRNSLSVYREVHGGGITGGKGHREKKGRLERSFRAKGKVGRTWKEEERLER